jgi:hypothetical protein
MRLCLVLVVACSTAAPAFGQRLPVTPAPRLIISERAISEGMAAFPGAAAVQSSRDSLKNGTLIGAAIGGVAMGAVGGWICHMLKEPSDPSCWNTIWPSVAIGAVIGAGAGAGIDALAMRDGRGRFRRAGASASHRATETWPTADQSPSAAALLVPRPSSRASRPDPAVDWPR